MTHTPQPDGKATSDAHPHRQALRQILADTQPSDFDGHTAFARLTPAQRLDALGRMIAVVAEFKGVARR